MASRQRWPLKLALAGVVLGAAAVGGAIAWRGLDWSSHGCIQTGNLGTIGARLASRYDGVCLDRPAHGLIRLRYTEPDGSGATANAARLAVQVWQALPEKPDAVRVQDDRYSDGNADVTFSAAQLRSMSGGK